MTTAIKDFDVAEELASFGASVKSIRQLEGSVLDPRDELAYGDLLSNSAGALPVKVSAIVEAEGRPFIYAVRRFQVGQAPKRELSDRISKLARALACRGSGAYLALIEPGQLTLYPCSFGKKTVEGMEVSAGEGGASSLIQGLLHADLADDSDVDKRLKPILLVERKSAHGILIKTINSVANRLMESPAFAKKDGLKFSVVLALIGRALFTRFLIDRRIVGPAGFGGNALNDSRACFDDAKMAAQTCFWLDSTFNGDFLKINTDDGYERLFLELERCDADFFRSLGSLLYSVDSRGQLALPLWSQINFAHVPVGLLSEVYEDYVHRYGREEAERTSVHYTPRHIAELIVDQAFAALKTAPPYEARILDPASGAGVFLTVAFKRLYLELWERNKQLGLPRPGTAEIRSILYHNLRGYDINPAALTLSALSLYLTAIELDPNPSPPERLRFSKNLLGTVLFDLSSDKLGSLGADIPDEWSFDVVLGNPPWTSIPGLAGSALTRAANSIGNRALKERFGELASKKLGDSFPYKNPDKVPDLPFVFRATEWAKEGGVIAFAMHSRLLFKNSKAALLARNALFRLIRVNGIINGSALRQSNQVWPGVSAPFCLLFAYNEASTASDAFNYLSPFHENSIAGGRIRIDPRQVMPVRARALENQPFLLKALFRGDVLDAPIIERLHSMTVPDEEGKARALALSEYLDALRVERGQGYIVGTKSQDASDLLELSAKHLTAHDATTFVINDTELDNFDLKKLQWPRRKEIYLGPLVLIREAPAAEEGSRVASIYLKRSPLVYSATFVGLSFNATPNSIDEAIYVSCIANSNLFKYWMLLTSGKFGVERDAWNDGDFYCFPVIALPKLSDKERAAFDVLKAKALEGSDICGTEVDEFINLVYGISPIEARTIQDTLSVNLPMAFAKKNASRRPTNEEVTSFVKLVGDIVAPMLALGGVELKFVERFDLNSSLSPWWFIDITENGKPLPENGLSPIQELADEEGCTQIIWRMEGGARVGLRAQYRYWTPSRARLLADELLRRLWG